MAGHHRGRRVLASLLATDAHETALRPYIALLTTVTLALAGAYLAWTALDVMDRWRTTPGGVCSAGSWSPSDGSPTINDLQPDPSRSMPQGRLGAVGVRAVITGADESLDVHDEGDGLSLVVEHGVVVAGVEGDTSLAVAIRQDRR